MNCHICASALTRANMSLDSNNLIVCCECYLATVTEEEVENVLAAVAIDSAKHWERTSA